MTTTTTGRTAPAQALSHGDKTVIATLLVATFVVILNETILGVALPRLMHDLSIDANTAQWPSTAFMLTMAVVIPTTGFLLQRLSTRTVFVLALGLFFCLDRKLGPPQWSDVGMYMQNVMLLAQEQGIDTCAQEYWARYPKTVAEFVGLPDDHMVFSGMAMGYRDDSHPINSWRTRRDPFEVWCAMDGFED